MYKTLTNVESDETFCPTAMQTVDGWAVAEAPANNGLGRVSPTSSFFISLTHGLQHWPSLSFLFYLSIFHSHAPFCPHHQLSHSAWWDPDAGNWERWTVCECVCREKQHLVVVVVHRVDLSGICWLRVLQGGSKSYQSIHLFKIRIKNIILYLLFLL